MNVKLTSTSTPVLFSPSWTSYLKEKDIAGFRYEIVSLQAVGPDIQSVKNGAFLKSLSIYTFVGIYTTIQNIKTYHSGLETPEFKNDDFKIFLNKHFPANVN